MSSAKAAAPMDRRGFLQSVAATVLATTTALPAHAAPGGDTGAALWVSANGKPGADGSRMRPFASLLAARDAARHLRATSPKRPVTVNLLGGDYLLSAEGLTMDASDGGAAAEAPVVWRAAPGEKRPPRLLAGALLPAYAFHPVTEASDSEAWTTLPAETRDKVLVADLGALGIHDYGDPPVLYRGEAPLLEVFFDGTPLPVAHYPNEGWAETTGILDTGSVPRFGDKTNRPGVFACAIEPDRLRRWATAPDAYVHGYFRHDWYDEIVRIGKIDPEAHAITTAVPVFYGIGRPDGVPKDKPDPPRRFIALNLLCELDSPGEWYLARKSGRLYLYPPSPLKPGTEIAVSLSTKPAIDISGASHVRIEGLSFAYTRGDAIHVSDGSGVTITRCLFDDIGCSGVVVTGGSDHRVTGCRLTRIGREGIVLSGGDRKTLSPAHHIAEANEVSFFGRRQRTYAGAIHLTGVGNAAIGNSLHDAPHTAIFLGGNDHIIERNEIYRVCLETDDCGAFYMGRDPSERGNILRWNYFHHVGGAFGQTGVGNNAVYFDDGASGNLVEGCIFYRCGNSRMGAVFMHGGQKNQIVNCLFIDCRRAVGKNAWPDARWAKFITDEEPGSKWKPAGIDPYAPPYTTRYPDLKDLARVDVPRRDTVKYCIAVGCDAFLSPERIAGTGFDATANIELPATAIPALVTNTDTGKLDPKAIAAATAKYPMFEPIPTTRIGL